jgi:Uma2 family endonuclease
MEDGMTATLKPATESVIKSHRFTVDEFQKMFEHGIVSRRSQLIQGRIYVSPGMSPAHAKAIRVLNRLLFKSYGHVADVVCQTPIIVGNDSELEPDFALIHPDFSGSIPSKEDVILAIEVSDSTLKFDRETKLPEYARSGIADAWILNLIEGQLEVYKQPEGEQYLHTQILKPKLLIEPEITLEWWQALETHE